MKKIVAIAGSTGLVGTHLRQQLSTHPEVEEVRLLVRKNVVASAQKEKIIIVDFSNAAQLESVLLGVDILFCAIGTTTKKVKGDRDAYRKVDFDVPYNLALAAKSVGVGVFVKVSAAGANVNSFNFYSKLKGEIEQALLKLELKSLYILRPSMLLGHRNESRPGEKVGQIVMQWLGFMIPKKWKAVHASSVAKAMIEKGIRAEKGNHIITNDEIILF